jgi:hypothetical protein
MRRLALLLVVAGLAWSPTITSAQTEYPDSVLEEYWACMERNDLDRIDELVWYHNFVEEIDASVYGLPARDFDDRSRLTINERLRYRADRAEQLRTSMGSGAVVPMAISGPVQYPHHLRAALDNYYETTGSRVDCSTILEGHGVTSSPDIEAMGSSWSSDLNLTPGDSLDRGEVDIAIDPGNPARIMASSCPGGGAEVSNHIAATGNWGASWSSTQVGNNSGTSWECDPVSFYQRSTGRVYHSKIGCSNGMCSQTYTMLRYSTNNGASWADCGRPGTNTSEDREWLVVDNTPTSSCYGTIYTTWHNSNQQKVARSTNNCSSWSNLTNLTGTYQAITPDINVGADGRVYAVWQNHGDSTFKIAGSADCGVSWNAPSAKTLTSRNGDWKNNITAQCQRGISSQPMVDVDKAPSSQYYGRVYVGLWMFNSSCSTQSGWSCTTWDSNWSNTCNYDFHLMYSDNNGSTWSGPYNITSGDGSNVDNFMGYMRVDPADGSIYVGHHRTRLNPSSSTDRRKTSYIMMRSTNGGSTWGEFQASSYEGDERLSGASSFERGDYNGITVYEGVAWPVWIDRRGGSGEEEIVTRKICSEPSHWTERAPSFTAPATTCSDGGAGTVDVTWAAPDIYWGDGGEATSSRKYQLWVDGGLAQDNISWSATTTNYDPGDAVAHTYVVRAINSCDVYKDYAADTFTATSGCANNPTSVSVTPDGPLTLCTGSGQTLTATATGGSGLSYQWTRNGSPIAGATSSTYYAADSGTYSYNCVVTGSGCSSGVQDGQATQITWSSDPDFDGATSAEPITGQCGIRLGWDAATPICTTGVSYNVYRSTSPGFTPSGVNNVATCVGGTTYDDTTGLSSGIPYYYIVRAEDGASGGGGPCNDGFEDDNVVQVSATIPGSSGDLLNDAFESATDWANNWVVTTGPGAHTCGDWARSSSSTQRPPNSTGYYALTDSDACGSTSRTSTDLTSVGMNADGATSLTLDYDMYYRHYNGDDAKVQVWNGSSWVTIWSDTNSTLQTHHSWDVTAYANADFKVRFSYQNAAWDWWFAVDNVVVTAEMPASCP